MPLVYQQNINDNTKIGVWHIAEDEGFFRQKVSINKEITHPHKRLQHLAGRYLLRELVPDFPLHLILIADTRKPYLKDEAYHFSISHCGDYAAVILSSESRVGVDIERPQQKIVLLKQKFLDGRELDLLLKLPINEIQQYTLGWSIKEAVFKWYGAGKVDFRNHISLRQLHSSSNGIKSSVLFKKEKYRELETRSQFIEENFLTWVLS